MWTEYMSTDAGAPVLDGNVGSMNTVLRAILVKGTVRSRLPAGRAFRAPRATSPFRAERRAAALLRERERLGPARGAVQQRMRVPDQATRRRQDCPCRPGFSRPPRRPPTGSSSASRQCGVLALDRIRRRPDAPHVHPVGRLRGRMAAASTSASTTLSRATPDAFNGIAIGRLSSRSRLRLAALPSQETLHILHGRWNGLYGALRRALVH
jgi:hypothetical protein